MSNEKEVNESADLGIDFEEIARTVKKVQKEEKEKFESTTLNRASLWDNFFGFLVPIWGIFVAFMNLQKYPKRSKSLFVCVAISMILQGVLLYFCYHSLFEYLGKLCVMLIG